MALDLSVPGATPQVREGRFCASHLQRLRPLRKGAPAHEKFIIPQIREIRGTPFALTSDEERFVHQLLGSRWSSGLRKHNLWVFRVHQQRFAGDFVVVDVSSPLRAWSGMRLPWWDVFVLDLKMNAPLKLGGGGAGIQMKYAPQAAQVALYLCAHARGAVPHRGYGAWRRELAPRHTWQLTGDRRELLTFFDRLRLMRRKLRRSRGDLRQVEEHHRKLHHQRSPRLVQ